MRKVTLHAAMIIALLIVFGAGSFALAHGNKRNIRSDDMSGYLEAPPVSSVASGSFKAWIDDANDEIHYTLTYENLEAPVAQSHIHFGQRSVTGGISAWLCEGTVQSPSPSTPACPGQGGTVSGVITPAEVIGPGAAFPPGPAGQGIAPGEFEELVAAIRAGRAYANVHSAKFPGGEIRGQLNDRNQRDD
ncbi:MAG TPA: CHRD domain-containing protein [Gaiellaceae bacterium]|nr:CHRD domain-containing protein [Gaiellaceae bacterium]